MPLIDSKVARDLLLHKLPEEEAEAVAERVIEDEELADQLELESIDLLDDLARGVLDAEDAKRARLYLATDGNNVERLQFAQALALQFQTADRDMKWPRRFVSRPRYWMPSVLAACLLLVVAVTWFFPSGQSVSRRSVAGRSDIPGDARVAVDTTFTVALLLAESRGADSGRIEVPASATALRLECELPEAAPFSRYEVVLKDAEGKQVAASEGLSPETAAGLRFVAASFPTIGLRAGRYLVSIRIAGEKRAPDLVTYKLFLKLANGA